MLRYFLIFSALVLYTAEAEAGQVTLHTSYNLFGPQHPGYTFTPSSGCVWPDTANTSWTENLNFGVPTPEIAGATFLVVWQPPVRLQGDTSAPIWVNIIVWSYDAQSIVIGPFSPVVSHATHTKLGRSNSNGD
jgi:hypothetical protein